MASPLPSSGKWTGEQVNVFRLHLLSHCSPHEQALWSGLSFPDLAKKIPAFPCAGCNLRALTGRNYKQHFNKWVGVAGASHGAWTPEELVLLKTHKYPELRATRTEREIQQKRRELLVPNTAYARVPKVSDYIAEIKALTDAQRSNIYQWGNSPRNREKWSLCPHSDLPGAIIKHVWRSQKTAKERKMRSTTKGIVKLDNAQKIDLVRFALTYLDEGIKRVDWSKRPRHLMRFDQTTITNTISNIMKMVKVKKLTMSPKKPERLHAWLRHLRAE